MESSGSTKHGKYGRLHRPSDKNSPRSHKLVFLQCYFVTIATILGTGILGLPVTLAHSGLYPFLVSFILGFMVQALLICFVTDLLQRAYALQLKILKSESQAENVPLYDIDAEEDWDDIEEEKETDGPVMAGHIILPKDLSVQPPNLHLLGQLFLCCGLRQMFDVVIVIQFLAFLISYALAGSEAYAEVIGVDHFYVIPVFVWVLSFCIVFALKFIQPIVSILTFVKGSLILATVVVTFFVGASIQHQVNTDFTYVGAPFLMGTVALGGVMNVMPFLYAKIEPVPHQVRGFRASILLGLVTCAVINILWCWAVLDIVPQTNSCFTYEVKHNNSLHIKDPLSDTQEESACSYNLSLYSSAMNGEISTIPLTKIINHLYPAYNWVAILVEVFIMISITVSYLTIGAALYHTISGWLESVFSKDKFSSYTSKQNRLSARCKCCTRERVIRVFLSLFAFGIVFAVAMLNPKGFEQMLEKAASLFLNIEAGIFMFIMIVRSRNSENKSLCIPLPMAHWTYHLQYLVPIYFGFAVVYDIFTTVYTFVYRDAPLPWEHISNDHGSIGLPPDQSTFTTATTLFQSLFTTTPPVTEITEGILL